MESSIFKFVLRYSKREQLLLLAFTLLSFPFLYLSLDLPKTIINEAIGGTNFPRELLGRELEQMEFLVALCVIFLGLVFTNGAFKFFLNVYRGTVGERMLRRLRYQLFSHVLRFPLPQFRKLSQGEIVSMVTSETEPLGGFIGNSVALPVFQGGTLITILVFMFVQDWKLGTAAIILYPLQAYIIPKLQRRLNLLKKDRIYMVRKLSERIGEAVTGIRDVHTHDTSQFELADFSKRVGEIFYIRVQIFRQKFFIKFVNNFIAQITPFFFYSIGGYLVIRGELSFGALVAILAAYKDLSDPWKELLNFYQVMEDARIKYDLLYDTFRPHGLLDEDIQLAEPLSPAALSGDLIASNVDLSEEDEGDTTFAGGLSLRLQLPQRVAVLGSAYSGKDRLAAVVSGLKRPASGSITIAGVEIGRAPESITGRRIAFAGQEASLRAGSLRDNLLYSLKHRPVRAPEYEEAERAMRAERARDAVLAGNSAHDIDADWIDYAGAGVDGPDALTVRAIEVLTMVDMDEDIYHLGLQGTADPKRQEELVARLLEARAEMRARLQDPELATLVELFNRDTFNTNMSVAENLLFGTPRDGTFDIDNLADNGYVRKVLHESGLMTDFLSIGRQVAGLMVELFADVAPDSDLFEQFAFISAEQLPEFKALLVRTEGASHASMNEDDRRMLLSLPFKLVVARHRLGLFDEAMQSRVLEARRQFGEGFGTGSPPVEFFDRERYDPAISIQDNILFGRLAYGKARSSVRVGELMSEVIEKLGLKRVIMEIGLDFPVGIAGSRLSTAQRQKVAIARCVLKRPDVLVLDQATAVLDGGSQQRILANLFAEFQGRALIWLVHRASLGEEFDYTLVMENGKVVERGSFGELNAPGTLLNELVLAG